MFGEKFVELYDYLIKCSQKIKEKHKNKIDILDNNLSNYQVVNTFLNRNNSNKSSVFPSNENQMSFLINSKNLEQKNDIKNSEEKKIKRHKTVYIKKNLSVERNIKTNIIKLYIKI